MATVQAPVSHIHFDQRGVPWIDDTNIKVIEVVLDKLAYGWSAEEIHAQHYGTLTLGQIHAALGYYYDHQVEMDAEIARQLSHVDELRTQAGESPFVERMRALGRLP